MSGYSVGDHKISKLKHVITVEKKGTHEINRTRVCLLCHKKPKKINKIQGVLERRIESLYEEYDNTNIKFPNVVCNPCRRKIYDAAVKEEGIDSADESYWGEVINFEDGSCGCTLCQIVKCRQSVLPVRSKN